MIATATNTVTVLRGTATDEFGDVVDTGSVASSGNAVSIIEQRRSDNDPVDGRSDTVLFAIGRCQPSLSVAQGDRWVDELTGDAWVVQDVSRVGNPIVTQDQRVDLVRLIGAEAVELESSVLGASLELPFVIGS